MTTAPTHFTTPLGQQVFHQRYDTIMGRRIPQYVRSYIGNLTMQSDPNEGHVLLSTGTVRYRYVPYRASAEHGRCQTDIQVPIE